MHNGGKAQHYGQGTGTKNQHESETGSGIRDRKTIRQGKVSQTTWQKAVKHAHHRHGKDCLLL